ncbi:4'-phosphopantetheinyl transferase superfamily protein [Microbispora sp. RL4-1S]|uniref:4'-phosphopantetheinyl transferase superfamily protein n=1 Tax=Microbispora oryzae TaxID=2806554 RepID=A0A940WJN5_9ACTN|nr:4'-phosphopantetheinyl transferase superfamily protein [Microbispora oryzae]MBP2702765.1 4'-phosphopantetheinyl transferase superfamily protein [Microbispora oryzae]
MTETVTPETVTPETVTPETVRVWRIRLDVGDDVVARLRPVLDGRERARADRLVSAGHRRRYVVAHGALRHILSARLGVPPGALRWTAGPNGKPRVAGRADVEWNLSHSGDVALVAVTGGRPVGVDVETARPAFDAGAFAARFFPAEDGRYLEDGEGEGVGERFARLWTRREACVKAAGARLAQGLRLPVGAPGPLLVRDPTGTLPGPWLVWDVEVDEGFVGAVALAGAEPVRVVTAGWSP